MPLLGRPVRGFPMSAPGARLVVIVVAVSFVIVVVVPGVIVVAVSFVVVRITLTGRLRCRSAGRCGSIVRGAPRAAPGQ